MSQTCDKCGHPLNYGDSSKEEPVQGSKKVEQVKDEVPRHGGLKLDVRSKFKFHGLLTTYDTLVKDFAATKGTKILNRHYQYRKEFLEDVTTLCTIGLVKNKLVGLVTHMDNDKIEFFIENNETPREEETGLLSAFKISMKHWLPSHMDEQKVGFVTINDVLQPLMQREEPSDTEMISSHKVQADAIKKTLIEHNIDWQIFCITLSPPLDAINSTKLSSVEEVIQNVAQNLIGQNVKVTKVSGKDSD